MWKVKRWSWTDFGKKEGREGEETKRTGYDFSVLKVRERDRHHRKSSYSYSFLIMVGLGLQFGLVFFEFKLLFNPTQLKSRIVYLFFLSITIEKKDTFTIIQWLFDFNLNHIHMIVFKLFFFSFLWKNDFLIKLVFSLIKSFDVIEGYINYFLINMFINFY